MKSTDSTLLTILLLAPLAALHADGRPSFGGDPLGTHPCCCWTNFVLTVY